MSESSNPSAPILRADHLEKVYPDGSVHALRGVSMSVDPGESLAIVGPSGCGKSTLLQLLGGLDRPTRGTVFYQGRSLAELDRDTYRAREIGFVFQSFHLIGSLSAVENVQIPMFEAPFPRRERALRAAALLEEVGLAHRQNHRPSRLSTGERQRVAIARALANKPRLLLADEPTGNLDSQSQASILSLLNDLRCRLGLTLVLITHSPEVASAADRILHLLDGLVVMDS